MSNGSSNSWSANQQWSSGQGFRPPLTQQGQDNWMQTPPSTGGGGGGRGEWQAMQQGGVPSQVPFQGQQGQFPFQGQGPQYYGGGVPQGYPGGGQYGGHTVGQGARGTQGQPPIRPGGPGFPPAQQFMTPQQRQQLHQQELERKAKEEQRQREVEIQRRKMKNMNISKPSSGALEDLIALPSSKRTASPGTSRAHSNTPPLSRVSRAEPSNAESNSSSSSSTNTSAVKKTYSPSVKARAWTADTASLEGVFAQHVRPPPAQSHEEDFGEFHTGLASTTVPHHTTTGQDMYGGNLTAARQRPVAATSISGLTMEGYSSTDTLQSRSQVSYGSQPKSSPVLPSSAGGFSGLDAAKFPAVYMEVYGRCAEGREGYLNTELLFPVLLSSQLPTGVLRDLWNQANRALPGKLNQTELFVLLGLIGLVQSGNSSPTIEDLKQAPQPPIPHLSALQPSTSVAEATPPSKPRPGSDDFGDFQQSQEAASKPNPAQSVPPPPPSTAVLPDLSSTFPVPDYKPPTDDKYSVFSQLDTTASTKSQSQLPGSSQGLVSTSSDVFGGISGVQTAASEVSAQDKYGALKAFSETTSSSVGMPDTFKEGLQQTPSLSPNPTSSSTNPTPSDGSTLLPSAVAPVGLSSNVPDDDFGAFSSGPMPSQPTGFAASQSGSDSSQGWANFESMSAPSLATTRSDVPIAQPVVPPVSTKSGSTISALTTSVFDDLLPKELIKNRDTKVVDLLEDATTKSSPDTKSKKVTKQLTGFEILEEEMSNRLSSHSTEPKAPPPPALSGQALMPEPVGSTSSTTSLENFGDFEGYSGGKGKGDGKGEDLESNSGSSTSITARAKECPDVCKVWSNCLDKCLEVLSSCAAVFTSVEEAAILQEIAQSEEGRNRLKCIVEVYRFTRRIYYSIKERKSADSCKETVEGIKEQWRALVQTMPGQIMEELYRDTNPEVVEEMAVEGDFLSDTISRCSLCLVGKSITIPAALSLTLQPETYSLPLIFHAGQMYHSACANFWINVVQEKLPDLSESF